MANPSWFGMISKKAHQVVRSQSAEDDDDQWSDTTSSTGDPSPQKKMGEVNLGARQTDPYMFMEEKMAHLLPCMPSILGKDLPPCGLHPQVAYENLNRKIRHRWLYFRGENPVTDICRSIGEDLGNQEILWPPFTLKGKKKPRTPWRHELVFQYELRWIKYFIRESQIVEPMTESELLERRKEQSIPFELRLGGHEEKYVLDLWESWHKKKRAPFPPLPGAADLGQQFDAQSKVADSEGNDSNTSLDSSETVLVSPPLPTAPPPTPMGKADDFQLDLRTRPPGSSPRDPK